MKCKEREQQNIAVVVCTPIVYFLKTTRAVCPNTNPMMLCVDVHEVNYAACYYFFISSILVMSACSIGLFCGIDKN